MFVDGMPVLVIFIFAEQSSLLCRNVPSVMVSKMYAALHFPASGLNVRGGWA
jgi:hypothetical protein